jgi:hypothetical protein
MAQELKQSKRLPMVELAKEADVPTTMVSKALNLSSSENSRQHNRVMDGRYCQLNTMVSLLSLRSGGEGWFLGSFS